MLAKFSVLFNMQNKEIIDNYFYNNSPHVGKIITARALHINLT